MEIVIYIVSAVLIFFLGYQFALMRWRVKDMMEATKILIGVLDGSIGAAEAKMRYEKILPKTFKEWKEENCDNDPDNAKKFYLKADKTCGTFNDKQLYNMYDEYLEKIYGY